ncbi:alcohol dehydrogenase 1-like [Harmonia axyridis]|uniref:alcohol dehydrogenase 1-like n=1 Tax=Harmonia axyridis TaxID=115357 RepID=UPI001E27506E|nr:alcohol dehydrogenase 1-like [Harmonia axyridis]
MAKFIKFPRNYIPHIKYIFSEATSSRLYSCGKGGKKKDPCKPPCPCPPPKPPCCPPPCPPKPPCCPPPCPCPCPPKPPCCPPPCPCPPKPPCCPPPCPPKPPCCPPPCPHKPPCCPPPPCPCPPKPPCCPPPPCPCPPKPPCCPPPPCPCPPKPPCCPPPCPCPPKPCCGPCCSPAIAGKTAVITGGALGIGYYCALAILKNGGKVMLGDVKVQEGKDAICKIIDQFGYNRAAFIKCDVSKAQDMECLFNAALCEFKQIDILINNAGILEDALWQKTVDINITGLIRGTLLGFHYMRRNRNGGRIINLSSILGHRPFHACPVYTGSKHFVIGFSRSMGSDFYFCQTGVKVMTLCPGVTLTPMVTESGTRPQLEGFSDTSKELHEGLYSLPTQTVEVCGSHIVPMLEADINGSDWISENNEVYRVSRVDYPSLRICC